MERTLLSAKKRKTRRSHSKKRAPAKHRRKYSRRKKGMLSEIFNPAQATHSAQNVLFGAIGGVAGYGIIQLMKNSNMSPIAKALILGGASFVMGSIVKAPIIASGIAGIGAVCLISEQGRQISGMTTIPPISEPPYLSEIDLKQLPAVLDEGYLDESYLGANYLSAPYM